MTLLATTYCTQAELERLLSANGVLDYADHDDDGSAEAGVVDDTINQATVEIDLYAGQRYSAAALAGSTLVSRWCTIMAAYFLSYRRGNPPPDSIADEFERIANPETGLLAKVAAGKLQLSGVPLRADLRPTMSNVTVDRRHLRSTIRVTAQNSSDADTAKTQDKMHERVFVTD